MKYVRGSDVVYRNGAILSVGVLAGALWIVTSTVDLMPGRENTAAWSVLGILLLAGGIQLNLRQRVVLGESQLSMYRVLSTKQIRYESIASARFTGRRAGSRFLELYLTDGSKVGVHSGRASLMPFHDPGWQRPLANEIMHRAALARGDDGSHELATKRRDEMPSTHPLQDSRSDRERQDRMRLVFAVAADITIWIAVALLSTDQPLAFLGGSLWLAATVLTVVFAVMYLRRRVLTRIPTRFTESQSKPIRVLTMVAKGLAIYAVGLLALIAALDVPTFLIEHL
ncbi:MAG: hypothetical protein WBV06_10160 [Acidimicrobiia bacterium]